MWLNMGSLGWPFTLYSKERLVLKYPLKCKKDFTLKELWAYLWDNYNSILKDQRYEKVLEVIQNFIPEAVRVNKKNELDLNKDVLEGAVSGLAVPKSMKK